MNLVFIKKFNKNGVIFLVLYIDNILLIGKKHIIILVNKKIFV